MKKLLLLLSSLFFLNSPVVLANEVNKMAIIDGESQEALYMDNGLPKYYELLDGKTPIYIEFTDVIQGVFVLHKNGVFGDHKKGSNI